MRSPVAIEELRSRIRRIEANGKPERGLLPFGISVIDGILPSGGLALAALHEVAGGGNGAIHGAAAALFAAGILARLPGQVLWCITRRDLFAPALAQAGLHPDRVIYVEVGDEKALLSCFEEGLRHGGLAGVVGEVAKLSMTVSRAACNWLRKNPARLALRSDAGGGRAMPLILDSQPPASRAGV